MSRRAKRCYYSGDRRLYTSLSEKEDETAILGRGGHLWPANMVSMATPGIIRDEEEEGHGTMLKDPILTY